MSIDEVLKVEEDSFLIQIDTEFFVYRGKCAFSGKIVDGVYHKVMSDLLRLYKTGNKAEAMDAMRCMSNTRIWPLRIQ
jgi:hypothetical protein